MTCPQVDASQITLSVVHADYPGRTWPDLKFDAAATIAHVKDQLYRRTGTTPNAMVITALNNATKASILLSDDGRTLSSYGITSNFTLHVEDTDPQSLGKQLANAEAAGVPKFKLSDEAYERRPDNVRNFIKKMREQQGTSAPGTVAPEIAAWFDEIPVGRRCELVGGVRGVVAWKGELATKKGLYIGVKLDEPMGNFDGKDGGAVLFSVDSELYGKLIKVTEKSSDEIKVGNFPPLDPFDEV